MILPALIRLYDRRLAAGEGVAREGYALRRISFCINLCDDGAFAGITDMRTVSTGRAGKPVERRMLLPFEGGRSGKKVKPFLLSDTSEYALGIAGEDSDPEFVRKKFEKFRERHMALAHEVSDAAVAAVARFVETWDPDGPAAAGIDREILTASCVFRVGDSREYVHERPALVAWLTRIGSKPAKLDVSAFSLADGMACIPAKLHEPAIQGPFGSKGKSSGMKLVSFDKDAFTSYGKSQGANAPVSKADAFKYCTVLNSLLADPSRRTVIGDATVVWWSEAPTEVGEDVVSAFFTGRDAKTPPEAEEVVANERVRAALDRLTRGLSPERLPDGDVRFNVLGLAPNAARLSVRFWWTGPIADMLEHVRRHHEDLRLEPVPPRELGRPFSISRIVRETARVHSERSDMDTVPPTLAGELARAVLSGGAYPQSLLETITRRVRADGRINHTRCAIVKACITRRRRTIAGSAGQPEEVPVSLNKEGPVPYQLGRLFATLEKTQSDAIEGVGAGIRDRYFGSASATPASVFPRLIRLTQHHMGKLECGRRVNREKLIQEICMHIDAFPRHLSLEGQGLFQIGYYHQREALFAKKNEEPEPALAAEES